MNFLAHAYLSFNDPDVLMGNMMADAVRGKQADEYPDKIRNGILLHRRIDAFTDQHELVKATRKLFYPVIHHYALVISDVIYDHFLGNNWNKFSKEELSSFSIRSYNDMENRIHHAPEKFKNIFPFMQEHNWFMLYASKEGIHETIQRLSHRSKQFIWDKETVEIFELHYQVLETQFLAFFPQLVEHSQTYLDHLKQNQ
jgi:acyl carrier protein phosphodiesterase